MPAFNPDCFVCLAGLQAPLMEGKPAVSTFHILLLCVVKHSIKHATPCTVWQSQDRAFFIISSNLKPLIKHSLYSANFAFNHILYIISTDIWKKILIVFFNLITVKCWYSINIPNASPYWTNTTDVASMYSLIKLPHYSSLFVRPLM